jgi:hypothetical protein
MVPAFGLRPVDGDRASRYARANSSPGELAALLAGSDAWEVG